MASIWDFWNDEDEATNDLLGRTPGTTTQSESVSFEQAPEIVEEETVSEEDERQWQEEEFEAGKQRLESSEFELADAASRAEAKRSETIKSQLNSQLAQLNKQAAVIINNRKFEEIKANRDRSLKSIYASARAIALNPYTKGTNFGKMKLQNLYAMEQDIMKQSQADLEKLGGMAWENMDSDSRIVYSQLMSNPQLSPEDRVKYTENHNIIKKTSQNILLNIPEDRRDQVDEYLFGKKKIENGQVQYDQDNEPIRVTKGVAYKNQFGVYEPSVDMDVFQSKLMNMADEFEPATAGNVVEMPTEGLTEMSRADRVKKAKSIRDEYKEEVSSVEEDFLQAGGDKEDFTLDAAAASNVRSKEEIDRIKQIKKEADETLKYGDTLTPEARKEEERRVSREQVATTLETLKESPETEALAKLGKEGQIRTFNVENNKLIDYTPADADIKNNDYIIIVEKGVGPQLVKIGSDKLNKFLENAQRYFFVDGEFKTEPPGFTGAAIRATTLGLVKPEIQAAKSEFNKYLKDARNRKLAFDKEKAQKPEKSKLEELPWQ